MIQVKARSIITSIRDLMLPPTFNNYKDGQNWRTCRGLAFSFDVQISQRDSRVECRQAIHVILAGNSQAFVAESPTLGWDSTTTWKNVGNHDSCWIDSVDTELTRIYFAMCSSVNKHTAPKNLDQYTTMNVFRPLTLVEVVLDWDTDRNENDGQQYWKTVVGLKKLTREEFDAYDNRKES